MKYFREYPWFFQLVLFFSLILTMAGFGSYMVITLLPKLSPYTSLQLVKIDENSPAQLISVALTVQGILSLFIFFIPAFLFAYLAHPRPLPYLGLRLPGKKLHWVLVILLMLGASPVLNWLESLIGLINFGARIKASQAANDQLMGAMLKIPDFYSFVKAFVIMAIIPAFGEEMLFRGILLRFARKKAPSMVFPVVFTALTFAYAHTNIYGFVSIFIAGVVLAYIYYLTGSLLCSIAAHMFFNGMQVVMCYVAKDNKGITALNENNTVPAYLVIGGLILFGAALYLLIKNKTPLPDNWTDDFPTSGPSEGDLEFIAGT